MSFFDSDIIREEMESIFSMQSEIYRNIQNFPKMSRSEKFNHVECLSNLLEKQRVLYARLSLSDDPEAIEMKNKIEEAVNILGFENADMNLIFKSMKRTIEHMQKSISLDTKET